MGLGEGPEHWVLKSWIVWREAGCGWREGHSIELSPLNCFPEAESHSEVMMQYREDKGTNVCVVCISRVPLNAFPLCPWHPELCLGHGGTRKSVFRTLRALSYLILQ